MSDAAAEERHALNVHRWLQRHYPKSGTCERCRRSGKTQYAFQRHPAPYTRERSEYVELCAQCHMKEHIAAIPPEEKTCSVCSETFTTKRKASLYCSARCKQKAHRDSRRYVTENPERFRLFRLCDCPTCEGKGKVRAHGERRTEEGTDFLFGAVEKCPECRGEGRIRQELATCASPEAVGVAIVTLAREGEWDECPLGLLDSEGEKGKKWLVTPWLPSARNVTDAARTLAKSKKRSGTP